MNGSINMANTSVRLTLFAVISAIEEDLRTTFIQELAPQADAKVLFDEGTYERCKERLFNEESYAEIPTATQLIIFSDLGDLCQLMNRNRERLPAAISQEIRKLTPEMQSLIPIRNRVCHVRPLVFDDHTRALEIASHLVETKALNWTRLSATLTRIRSEPQFVLGLEIPADDDTRNHNLPSPDFDETGFLGRDKEIAQLLQLCRGPYPVISILGVGGIGKSALAIKVGYDILDLPDCPFDSVVWCSSKTMQLTPSRIVTMKEAISDSLKMLQTVSATISGVVSANPVDELLEYLREFRILIILDNLETVLDDRIRDFLARLPTGSKVLITSRIGIGAFDFPFKLEELSRSESVQLLRAVAKSRGVENLVKTDNKQLDIYCSRLKHNPGYIKWFVSAVQVGSRPEHVLANPELFLDFCVSNVYEHLSQTSRDVLDVMLTVPENVSHGELVFLNERAPLEIREALQQLLVTNMVVMDSRPRGTTYVTNYLITDLAREYLNKHHPVDPGVYERVFNRNRQLTALREEMNAKITNEYSAFAIAMRTKHDIVAAKYLRDTLKAASAKDFDRSESLLATAKELAPDYFEVYRVEGWLRAERGHISAARAAYDSAIELEPNSAQLRLWYGQLLLRADDAESALRQLLVARELDPDAVHTQIEIGRSMLYLRQYRECQAVLKPLLDRTDLRERTGRILWDLYLQTFRREADHLANLQDNQAAFEALESYRDEYKKCPSNLRDQRMKSRIEDVGRCLQVIKRFLNLDEEMQRRMKELEDWLEFEPTR